MRCFPQRSPADVQCASARQCPIRPWLDDRHEAHHGHYRGGDSIHNEQAGEQYTVAGLKARGGSCMQCRGGAGAVRGGVSLNAAFPSRAGGSEAEQLLGRGSQRQGRGTQKVQYAQTGLEFCWTGALRPPAAAGFLLLSSLSLFLCSLVWEAEVGARGLHHVGGVLHHLLHLWGGRFETVQGAEVGGGGRVAFAAGPRSVSPSKGSEKKAAAAPACFTPISVSVSPR